MDHALNVVGLGRAHVPQKSYEVSILASATLAAIAVAIAIFAVAVGPNVDPSEIQSMFVFP